MLPSLCGTRATFTILHVEILTAGVKWAMDRDLLPWILGGVLITTGAIAAAIQFTGHSTGLVIAPRSAPAASAGGGAGSALMVPAEAAIASVPPPASAPASAPAPAAAAQSGSAAGVAAVPQPPAAQASSADSASPPPAGQIWQCVVNGQKVFSDKRCGNGASVMQLGDLNVMDVPAAPPQPFYGRYPPGYGGGAYGSSAPPYPGDQDDTDNAAGDIYPGQQVIVARERARRERLRRLDQQARPSLPSRGAAGSRNPH
jgi:hypothetical protein